VLSPRAADAALAALRVIAGLVILQHGMQKMFGWFGGAGGVPGATAVFGTQSGYAAVLEMMSVLIVLGLFTRPVAFLLSGEMAVAYFQFHFPRGFAPLQNHGEVPVLLCFIFLYVAVVGGGRYSVDGLARTSREWKAAKPGEEQRRANGG
jgi:putative oxidoreductase